MQEVKGASCRQQAEAKRREYSSKLQVLSRRLVELQEPNAGTSRANSTKKSARRLPQHR